MLVHGRTVEDRTCLEEIGVKQEGIRFLAGLVNGDSLIDTISYALDCVSRVKSRNQGREQAAREIDWSKYFGECRPVGMYQAKALYIVPSVSSKHASAVCIVLNRLWEEIRHGSAP